MEHLDSIKNDLMSDGFARCPSSKTVLELANICNDLGLYSSELSVGYDKGELLLQISASPRPTKWTKEHTVDNS